MKRQPLGGGWIGFLSKIEMPTLAELDMSQPTERSLYGTIRLVKTKRLEALTRIGRRVGRIAATYR
jgi:hypothetical protein